MLNNFQRYFRFYLALMLFGLLMVGIRWQSAPLGATTAATDAALARPAHAVLHVVAAR